MAEAEGVQVADGSEQLFEDRGDMGFEEGFGFDEGVEVGLKVLED